MTELSAILPAIIPFLQAQASGCGWVSMMRQIPLGGCTTVPAFHGKPACVYRHATACITALPASPWLGPAAQLPPKGAPPQLPPHLHSPHHPLRRVPPACLLLLLPLLLSQTAACVALQPSPRAPVLNPTRPFRPLSLLLLLRPRLPRAPSLPLLPPGWPPVRAPAFACPGSRHTPTVAPPPPPARKNCCV